MSSMPVRKTLIGGPPSHRSLHHTPRLGSRRSTPRSSVDRIPPQAAVAYNEPAASDVLSAGAALEPVVKTMSVKEAAFRLRKSPDSIYLWLRHGRLKGWQPGGPGCQIQVLEASVLNAQKNILGTLAETASPA